MLRACAEGGGGQEAVFAAGDNGTAQQRPHHPKVLQGSTHLMAARVELNPFSVLSEQRILEHILCHLLLLGFRHPTR